MLAPIIEFFERLIENFTWRRLGVLAFALGLAAGSLWAYESYTETFKLARAEKHVALLERLTKLAESPTLKASPQLQSAYQNLQIQLIQSTAPGGTEYVLQPWAKKAIAAGSAWLALALLLLLSSKTSSTGTSSFGADTVLGMLVLAAPFVWLATLIPTFESEWINYFLYPVGHIVVIVVAILLWQRRRRNATSKQDA